MADVVLTLHIAAGTLGLVVGSVAILGAVRRQPGGWAGRGYHWLVLAVCASATALALLDFSELWFFVPIAAGSYAFALRAFLAEKRRRPGWQDPYIRGLGGAYIALVTALLVVSVGSVVTWVVPTLVGVPLLEATVRRFAGGDQPRQVGIVPEAGAEVGCSAPGRDLLDPAQTGRSRSN
jgi:hypothetical protein